VIRNVDHNAFLNTLTMWVFVQGPEPSGPGTLKHNPFSVGCSDPLGGVNPLD